MNVLITGGAGYLGTSLCQLLEQDPEIQRVVIYDNLSRPNYNLFFQPIKLSSKFQLIKGDILDTRSLRKALEGIDIVFHLAARVSTPFSEHHPHLTEQVNHWGTAELAFAMEESKVERVIYSSSASVYGASEIESGIPSVPNPRTFYGISKRKGEKHIARLENHGIKTFILRCGNVYGFNPSMRFDSVINKFMFEASFLRKISINGNGDQRRTFIHLDTLSRIMVNFLGPERGPGIYDLVESVYSINEIANTIKEIIPDLEMNYINQDIKLRELVIHRDERLENQMDNGAELEGRLREFKEHFSY